MPQNALAWVPGEALIPCGFDINKDGQVLDGVNDTGVITRAEECHFNSVIQLAKNIIDAMIYFSVLIAVAMFAFAGYKYLTAGGDMGEMKQARSIFTNVAIGFFFVLAAWLIVTTILSGLQATSEKNPLLRDVACKLLNVGCPTP